MSHFRTIIFTRDNSEEAIEKALAPFHEFECTGVNNEYVKDIDKTKEAKERYQEYLADIASPASLTSEKPDDFATWAADWYGVKVVDDLKCVDLNGEHKYGYVYIDPTNSENIKVVDRTNPDRKWDWWVIGGRYSGAFLPKKTLVGTVIKNRASLLVNDDSEYAEYVDVIQKQDVDFEGMKNKEIESINKLWDHIEKTTQGLEIPNWEALREKCKAKALKNGKEEQDAINEARKDYYKSPAIKALVENDPFFLMSYSDVIDSTREQCIAQAQNDVIQAYAFIDLEGRWHERGKMGWFGMSSDELSKEQWQEHLTNYFNSVDDDVYLINVDCHI